METPDIVNTLNELIQTSEDGMKGFAEAASKATDFPLKTELHNRSHLCAKAAQDLQAMVRSLGAEPEHGGSIEGAVHRGWIAVKAAFGNSDVAVLEEVERGEDHAQAVYRKALQTDLPQTVRTLVDEQYQGVVRNHDRVRDLRKGFEHAA
ncbi:MAG: PA2169 family four-helix-bundle protein [Panacagrimonas sp.]